MPVLNGFTTYRQAVPTSCWACAARSINNYYQAQGMSGANPAYGSDQDMANAWFARTGVEVNRDIGVMQSSVACLEDVGYPGEGETAPFPTPEEITEAIDQGVPLLAIIGETDPHGRPDWNYQGGHWLVIVGIDDAGTNILVSDPDTGTAAWTPYDGSTYGPGLFWENCGYIDPIAQADQEGDVREDAGE